VVGAVPAGVMHCKTLGLVTTGSIKEAWRGVLAVFDIFKCCLGLMCLMFLKCISGYFNCSVVFL
jgi:hypothetical protein